MNGKGRNACEFRHQNAPVGRPGQSSCSILLACNFIKTIQMEDERRDGEVEEVHEEVQEQASNLRVLKIEDNRVLTGRTHQETVIRKDNSNHHSVLVEKQQPVISHQVHF